MRIPCPICGERDSREFRPKGDITYADRPAAEAGVAAWHSYLHLRDNQPGQIVEIWRHVHGCGAWISVTRNTVSHAILGAQLLRDRGQDNAG